MLLNRWRLVSAPSIPGLLSLDPIGDPTSLLSSLTMGTEVEVQFGKSLQVSHSPLHLPKQPCSAVFVTLTSLLMATFQLGLKVALHEPDMHTSLCISFCTQF